MTTTTTTTTDGPRDGSCRAGENAMRMVHGATIECTTAGATSDSRSIGRLKLIDPTETKLHFINKLPGANRSPDAVPRRRRF